MINGKVQKLLEDMTRQKILQHWALFFSPMHVPSWYNRAIMGLHYPGLEPGVQLKIFLVFEFTYTDCLPDTPIL